MKLFAEVVNIVSIPAQNKGLKLLVDIDPGIPKSLFGDNDHIRQVLINLLNNAIKFTEKGEVRLEVHGNKGGTGFIELEYRVIDTGIGIHQEDLKKIFERFEQASNDKLGNVEGTGLGLFISKSLVGLMGGKLTVESEYGKGSTFIIRLVQRVCSEDTVAGMPLLIGNNQKVKTEIKLYAPKAKILSVDDNMVNNGVFYEFCKRFGIEAMLADSGYKAIEMVKQHRYDIIFLDQMMPGIDGVETLKEIRKLPNFAPETIMLAFTANAIRGNTELLMKEGFDDVIMKPIGIKELEEVLSYYLPESLIGHQLKGTAEIHEQIQQSQKSSSQQEVAATLEGVQELIDIEKGMEHCNNDKELYRQTLQMLVSYVPDKLKAMEEYVHTQDYDSYVIEVHALKNNAALIGATEISEEAKRLEFAGKEGRYEEIENYSDQLISRVGQLLKLIEKMIDSRELL